MPGGDFEVLCDNKCMGFRDVNRREYLRQPHVIVIGLLICLAVAGAVFTAVRRVQHMQKVANLETYEACKEFVSDDNLCRFASANQTDGSKNYVVTTTTTNGETTEISTVEVENSDRMKSVTVDGPKEIEAFVIIDDATYVKDMNDGVWAKYTDPDFAPSQESIQYNFSNASSEDVVEFRDYYKAQGKEPCGDFTCFKYQVQRPDSGATTFIWFDDQDFLMRRYQVYEDGVTTNNQFEYREITVEAPAPVKEVTTEELEEYL